MNSHLEFSDFNHFLDRQNSSGNPKKVSPPFFGPVHVSLPIRFPLPGPAISKAVRPAVGSPKAEARMGRSPGVSEGLRCLPGEINRGFSPGMETKMEADMKYEPSFVHSSR